MTSPPTNNLFNLRRLMLSSKVLLASGALPIPHLSHGVPFDRRYNHEAQQEASGTCLIESILLINGKQVPFHFFKIVTKY